MRYFCPTSFLGESFEDTKIFLKNILTDQCSKITSPFVELDTLLSVRCCTAVGETHHPALSGGTVGFMADVAKPGFFAACVLVLS